MEIAQFNNIYKGCRVAITGHTGFKGSWLASWLQMMNAEVTGISLRPSTNPNHWNLLNPSLKEDFIDIRDLKAVTQVLAIKRPTIVFHLAAQSLVRQSYKDPLETWSTNVLGTVTILEACRSIDSIKAIIVVTSDKCYDNKEWIWGYRENDHLGGHDPYSASKACEELVVDSYRKSFFNQPNQTLISSVRAGNVVGGGDWAADRLIPDVVRAVKKDVKLEIRSPHSTRPWQHVLEPLSGYLLLGQRLLENQHQFAGAWNFGPDFEGNRTVIDVLKGMKNEWPEISWSVISTEQPHESALLYLDCSKAKKELKWKPIWSFGKCLNMTARWYSDYYKSKKVETYSQIEQYCQDALDCDAIWCTR